ncbi:MAG: hypothetical protein WCI93_02635 [bacterium]
MKKEIKKMEVLQLLENLSKKDHDFVIVGSTVLFRNGLIKRNSDDVDLVVTSENKMKELISFMEKALGIEKIPDQVIECVDVYGHTWDEVITSSSIYYGVDRKVDFIVNTTLPEVDLENSVYCSRDAAIKHKVQKSCLVDARQKDISDTSEILQLSAEEAEKFKEFQAARVRVANLFFNNSKKLFDFLGSKKTNFYSHIKVGYGDSVAYENLRMVLSSKKFPEEVIKDILFLIANSGKIIEQLVW